jgi:hypothetical protein
MPVLTPSTAEGRAESADECVLAAIAQLKSVIDLLDAAKAPPELAARVQEAIDAAEDYHSS